MLISDIGLQIVLLSCALCRGTQALVHSSYVGCYEDSATNRQLTGYTIALPNMTYQICNYICFQKGFEFAGTQNKITCFCGDYDKRPYPQTIEDKFCDDKVGDIRSDQARLTLKVYRTGIEDRTDWEGKLVGCVSEEDPGFLVPRHKMEFAQTNSPGRCLSACSSMGFKHAGLSQSTICYCGEARKIDTVSGCDSPCPKRTKASCGGYSKTSLYETGADPGNTPILVHDLGCFKNRDGGLLKDFSEISAEMRPYRCVAECFRRGLMYAALHRGNECQCSLQLPFPHPEQVPDEFCTSKCAGNKSEVCGSPQHVTGYATSNLGRHPLYGKSLGCFKDTEDTPRKQIVHLDDNNPVNCIANCMKNGFAFAAVKMKECRCGNFMLKYAAENVLSDASCGSPCPDNSLTCGGDSAVAVYRTGLDFNAQESCSASITQVGREQVCSGKLIFEDNFDTLDYNKWQRTARISGEDYEFVTYSYDKTNSFVRDGKLHIKPTLLTDEDFIRNGELIVVGCTGTGDECIRKAASFRILPPVRTAQFTTKNVFSFKYGVINVRAKLPRGQWIYPQIWLKPLANAYGPDYWSGKLVLASALANQNLTSAGGEEIGASRVQAGVVMGQAPDTFRAKMVSFKGQPWTEEFHNFTVIWSPESIVMYVDDKRYDVRSIVEMNDRRRLATDAGFSDKDAKHWESGSKAAPFDQQFYLTLGLGVGGHTNFPDQSTSYGAQKPWHNYQVKAMLNFWQAKQDWFPTWTNQSELVIDYVSVHAL